MKNYRRALKLQTFGSGMTSGHLTISVCHLGVLQLHLVDGEPGWRPAWLDGPLPLQGASKGVPSLNRDLAKMEPVLKREERRRLSARPQRAN